MRLRPKISLFMALFASLVFKSKSVEVLHALSATSNAARALVNSALRLLTVAFLSSRTSRNSVYLLVTAATSSFSCAIIDLIPDLTLIIKSLKCLLYSPCVGGDNDDDDDEEDDDDGDDFDDEDDDDGDDDDDAVALAPSSSRGRTTESSSASP